jgi:plasmid stability protein
MPALLARRLFVPGSLSVRNLDDALILSLKRRAARHGHSAEAGFDDLAAELRALTAGRAHTPAETLLRESRDER